ncbi:MAG TPA: porin [Burkholderiales bacterium]|nr:porin [Burkholderiales bacterium]
MKRIAVIRLAGVAAALALPGAAVAQSSVTISGAINVWYEGSGATGASNTAVAGSGVTSYDIKYRDRVQDGNGSNIRFGAVEEAGAGLQAFMQVESAVINNANTRSDAAGANQTTGGWGTRNSGVGLRSQTWGEVLLGVWDVHYNEQDPVDNQRLRGPAHATALGLTNTFGAAGWATGAGSIGGLEIGARYSNVIRYQSPNWAGFNFRLAYARPSDGSVPTLAGTAVDGKRNRAINFAPQWSYGPIFVGASFLRDADIVATQATLYSGAALTDAAAGAPLASTVGSANAPSGAGTNLATVTSARFSAAYLFPFGLRFGYVYDRSRLLLRSSGAAFGDSEFKRSVWSVPLSFNTGPHTFFATYGQASRLNGSIGQPGGADGVQLSNVGVTPSGAASASAPFLMGTDTGARFYSLGYQFDFSKRTNLHLSYAQVKNDRLAGYDLFSNGVGMANGNFGADPIAVSIGLRHAF